MRNMAGNAAFRLDRRVLEYKRTCFVGVAVEANLVLRRCGAQLTRQEAAVLIVAACASHQTLVDAMVRRLDEVCLGFKMACVAELRLRLSQQRPLNLGRVHRMAVNTSDIVLLVLGATEVGVLFAELMTIEAAAAGIGGRKLGKADDFRDVATTFDVLLAGAVASLTAAPLRSAFLIEIGPPVRAMIETLRLGIVASSASVATNVERSISRAVVGPDVL